MLEKLDNPVWTALTENHQEYSIDIDGMKFYQPEYAPFGSFEDKSNTINGIEKYASKVDNFYIVGQKPIFSQNISLKNELVCDQMVLDKVIDLEISANITKIETESQKADLLELVNMVQPGYFKKMTSQLGNYYGIYEDAQLIAVAGERMKMKHFTEVSAVVTHPKHIGKGYAKQLVNFTCTQIMAENKTPFLHVSESNSHAIAIYEKLGFCTRQKISFWNFMPWR